MLFVGTVGQLLFCVLSLVAMRNVNGLYPLAVLVFVLRTVQVLIQVLPLSTSGGEGGGRGGC